VSYQVYVVGVEACPTTPEIPLHLCTVLVSHGLMRHADYEDTIKRVREAIHHKWKLLEFPEYYGYRPPYRSCWRFMTTNKFVVARLHQMRAGKSYLKAHRDWRDRKEDPTCPRCESRAETFHHVINECPSLADAREGHSTAVRVK